MRSPIFPVVAPSAPGNNPNMWSKLLFSFTMKTTCSIVEGSPERAGTAAGRALRAASRALPGAAPASRRRVFSAAAVPSQSARVRWQPSDAMPLAGVRVWIVDDNDTNRKILRYLTKSWGMIPTEAASGHAALALLRASRQSPFDVAIVDEASTRTAITEVTSD